MWLLPTKDTQAKIVTGLGVWTARIQYRRCDNLTTYCFSFARVFGDVSIMCYLNRSIPEM